MTSSTKTGARPQIRVAAVLLTAGLLLTTAGWAAANPPREWSPGWGTPLAKPHPVVGADGRRHLVYELQLINSTTAAITVTRVKTVDPATGRVLDTLDADAVAALMVPFGSTPGPTLGAGRAGFILMEVSLPPARRVPARLVHDFSLTDDPDLGLPAQQRSGRTHVARDRAPVVGAPLEGPRWVVVNGCCTGPNGHRQAVIPADGSLLCVRAVRDRLRPARRPTGASSRAIPEQLTSFPSYGANVLSVGRGVVVGTQDGIADNVPVGSLPPFSLETVGGNYVVVDIGSGRFAFYAHLQPGSLTVDVGDRVERGQVLGPAGQQRQLRLPAPALPRHGLTVPARFRRAPVRVQLLLAARGLWRTVEDVLAGGVAIFDPTLSGPHARQLPLELQVVRFPPRPHGGH